MFWFSGDAEAWKVNAARAAAKRGRSRTGAPDHARLPGNSPGVELPGHALPDCLTGLHRVILPAGSRECCEPSGGKLR